MTRRMKCKPLLMTDIFRWGDSTPAWDAAVDEYMALRKVNRLCAHINHRQQREQPPEL